MKLIQLNYYCGVVEHGGFIAAARELNVAQPALSRQISDLENELERQLLLRGPGGTTVTDAGQRFYTHAKKILEQISTAKADLQVGKFGLVGDISIALPVGMASQLASKIVQNINVEHPGIAVRIQDGLGYETGQAIDAGKVDFGLLANVGNLQNTTFDPVFEECLYLFSRRTGEPDTSDIDLITLQDIPLIVPNRKVNVRRMLENGMIRIGGHLTVAYEQQSLLTIRSMVKAGIGSAVMNWPSLSDMWVSGDIDGRRITNPGLSRTVCLGVANSRPLTATANAAYGIVRRTMIDEVKNGEWRGAVILDGAGAAVAVEGHLKSIRRVSPIGIGRAHDLSDT
jgi:LysR family transcriptional regulator, nitrogen assimilation regulatory protein